MANAGEIELKQFSVGPMDNNVYLLVCPETRESILVDAANEPERILLEVEGTRVRYILQTHGHGDHTRALEAVKAALGVPVGVHQGDAGLLPVSPDFHVEDGDRIAFGNRELRVIHTPGHTPGSVCFLIGGYLIAGDTLFPGGGGPGKTATKLGDFPLIIESIQTKLFTLPEDTQVLPGHGKGTTIGAEKPHLVEWIARGW